jgi:hypothetical protein
MGGRTSKEERKHREQAKDRVFHQAKQHVRRERVNYSQALMRYADPTEMFNQARESQLDRKGKPFTKTDLIALLLRLHKLDEKSPEVFRYQSLSNDDLRAFIRLKVYSPDVLEEKKEPAPQILIGPAARPAGQQVIAYQQYQPVEPEPGIPAYNPAAEGEIQPGSMASAPPPLQNTNG